MEHILEYVNLVVVIVLEACMIIKVLPRKLIQNYIFKYGTSP